MSKNKIGLALSGGGYRATIYHLGTLRKLKELNILDKIDVISSNSGGSITAAAYSLYHKDFELFENKIRKGVKKEIVLLIFIPLLIFIASLFTLGLWLPLVLPFALPSYTLLIWTLFFGVVLFRFQFRLFPVSKWIALRYDQIFFKGKKLSDLSPDFSLVINSTNVETGRIFHFSKYSMTDSTYGYSDEFKDKPIKFKHESFPISMSVMCSSCVPFIFSPVKIKSKYFEDPKDVKRISPELVDGGVYDNQGIHKLTFPKSSSFCRNVIVSDAGDFLPAERWSFNSLFILQRTSNIFMNRIKNLQMMMNLYREDTHSNVAYQSLAFNMENSLDEFMKMLKEGHIDQEVIEGHKIDMDWIHHKKWKKIEEHMINNIDFKSIIEKGCNDKELAIARGVTTGLSILKDNQIDSLIKHAEAITELQVRLFLPHLLK